MATSGDSPGNSQPVTSVLLADDLEMARRSWRASLESETGIEVVGEAADGQEAVDQARKLEPDVVVMDVLMPNMNGIEATREIVASVPEVRVIGISIENAPEIIEAMLEAGASAFVLKHDGRGKLIDAIRRVAVEGRQTGV